MKEPFLMGTMSILKEFMIRTILGLMKLLMIYPSGGVALASPYIFHLWD